MSSSFFVLGSSRMLLRAPDEILRAFERVVPAEPLGAWVPTFTIHVEAVGSSGDQWRFVLPDTTVAFGPMCPSRVAQSLLTQFTRLTILSHPDDWFIHAGAVAGPNGVVVAMAPSGTGKSTFTGRLLQAGYRYLSDEMAWIRPKTWEVLDYPKPIALDQTSLSLLGNPEGAVEVAGTAEWLLAARCFAPVDQRDRHSAVASTNATRRLGMLVCLTRGAGPRNPPVQVLTDADKAVAVLANQLSFMGHDDPLRSVCELLAEVPMVGMATDDLDAAVRDLATVAPTAAVAQLQSLVAISVPTDTENGPPSGRGRRPHRFAPFCTPQPVEPLSIAAFADGSAIVVGSRSGKYAVTNAAGARLAEALVRPRAIIDLAPDCDVSVRDAEEYFTRLGELCLVEPGVSA